LKEADTAVPATRDTEFRVEVVGRRAIADQVAELTLRVIDGPTPHWRPGAHIDLVFTRFLAAQYFQYSLCGDPDDLDTLTVAVQREPHGRGASLYVHSMVSVGKRRGGDWSLAYGGRTRASMAYLPRLAALDGEVEIRPQDEACGARLLEFSPLASVCAVWLGGLGRALDHADAGVGQAGLVSRFRERAGSSPRSWTVGRLNEVVQPRGCRQLAICGGIG
jgi:hypothetical protein